MKEAAEMLKEEARLLGGIDLPLLNGQYRADEKNHRIYAVQALANVLRTGSYDVETVYHLEMNYLTADMDYTRANDVLSVEGIELLQKRQKEILLKEAGDWVERTGLVGTVRGLAQLTIMTSNYFAVNGIKLAKKSPKIKDTKVKGAGGAKNILKAGSKADAIKSVNNLPSKIQAKVKSFFKGSSNSYTNYSVKAKSDSSYIAEMTKPGNVPGSKAIYYKEIDSMGNTIKVYKKTYDPTGKLVHTKNK